MIIVIILGEIIKPMYLTFGYLVSLNRSFLLLLLLPHGVIIFLKFL